MGTESFDGHYTLTDADYKRIMRAVDYALEILEHCDEIPTSHWLRAMISQKMVLQKEDMKYVCIWLVRQHQIDVVIDQNSKDWC